MPPDRATVARWALTAAALLCGAPPDSLLGQEGLLRFDQPPVSLPQPIVGTIVQDRDGFVWIGTQGGLVRYDGQTTRTYRGAGSGPRRLPSSTVRDVLEHPDGRLWVATLSGLGILSTNRDSVVHVTADNRPDLFGPSDDLTSLAEFPDGRVAAGSSGGGLVVFDADAGSARLHRYVLDDSTSVPSDFVDDVLVGPDGTLWVGTRGGLARQAPGMDGFERIPLPPLPVSGESEEARRLSMDPSGVLWIGGLEGVLRYDPATGDLSRTVLEPLRVQSLLTLHADSIWAGSYGGGLYLLDGRGRVRDRNTPGQGGPQRLLDGRVSSLMRDRSGLLWVGLWGRGVQTTDPRGAAFRFLPAESELSGSDVSSVEAGPTGRELSVTTYSGGIDLVTPEGDRIRTVGTTEVEDMEEVLHALWISSTEVLVSTMRMGLQRVGLDGARREYRADPRDPMSIPDANVYVVKRDHAGRVWVGTALGLRRMDLDAGTFQRLDGGRAADPLHTAFVRTLHVADDGTLWIGTLGDGLFIVDPDVGTVTRLATSERDDVPDDEIAAVTTTGDVGWFGTRSTGTLHRVEGWAGGSRPRVTLVGPPDGLGSAVQCLAPDAYGRVWASTSSGIVMVDPATSNVREFGAADGVPDGEFRTASCGLGPNGRMWFGQQSGVTIFDPDSVDHPHLPSRTVVSSAVFGDRDEESPARAEDLRVAYRQGLTSFRLAVLDFRAPQKQTFSYRLNEGAWVRLGSEASVTFANLQPGEYVFQARGADAHGVVAVPSDPVRFEVTPPFTMTVGFRALLLAALVGVLLLLYQWRTRTILLHNAQLRDEIAQRQQVEEQSAILEAQLRHAQKMEAVGRMTGGIAHDFNNLLTVLMGNAELLMESSRPADTPLVREIHEAGERAAKLVSQLMVFSRKQPLTPTETDLREVVDRLVPLLRRTLGDAIVVGVELPPGPAIVVVDPTQMESALLNLAINARDAMPQGGRLDIALRRRSVAGNDPHGVPEGDWWVLTAQDTGVGIPEHLVDRIFEPFFTTKGVGRGTGLGLSMVYGFVEQSGGRVVAESADGRGATFTLYLPALTD